MQVKIQGGDHGIISRGRSTSGKIHSFWRGREDRNGSIVEAHVRYGYTLGEIGRHLGIHYTTVGKIIKASVRN
jgi:hypothetical protein